MADRVPPIARVRLARSVPRLLALPVVLLALAAATVAGGIVVGSTAGLALFGVAALLGVLALARAAWALSIGLDVEESAIRVHWLGGERRYALTPGPVTRVRFRGESASRLRVRRGLLGGGLGRARLRDEEEIHIVRLAPTVTAILVPTELGRLAIAPAREGELLDALARAARARERLDEIAATIPEPGAAPVPEPTEPSGLEPQQPGSADATDGEPEVRPMTGIERMLYERRLAAERAAAEAAAAEEEAREQAERLHAAAEATPAEGAAGLAAPSDVGDVAELPAPASARGGRRLATRVGRVRVGRIDPSWFVVLIPVVGALAVWGIGIAGHRLPAPETDLGRLTALALVLAGPASAIGAIMARAWWPRLVGVVVVGGLAASALIGRVIVG